jgi:DNA-binding transcriptional LysR family regulator
MDIELRVLRYFVAVAEELHFGRAAERMAVSQPALSRQIADLEQQLGVQLLERTSRQVRLTEAGVALLAEARRTIAQAQQAFDIARRAGQGEVGRVRVGFLSSACNSILPPVIHLFRSRFPHVALELHELLDDEQIRRLEEGHIDIGFVRTTLHSAMLQSEIVLAEPLAAVLPAAHPLASAQSIDLAALAGEEFVLWPREEAVESYDEIIAACRNAGFIPRIELESARAPAILGLVAAGLGVSIVADSYRVLQREGITFVPIAGLTSTLRMVWLRNNHSPTLTRFLDVVRERTR